MRRMIIVLMLPIILFMAGCNNEDIKEEQQMIIPRIKFFYANQMQFGFRFVINGEELTGEEHRLEFSILAGLVLPGNQFDPSYDQLIFVHSQEEAVGLPDNVIAAWPSERTVVIIEGLHRAIEKDQETLDQLRRRRDAINIEDFGLSYPLTVTDLVDYWEKVVPLWNSLTNSEQRSIIRSAEQGAYPLVIEESDADEVDGIDEIDE